MLRLAALLFCCNFIALHTAADTLKCECKVGYYTYYTQVYPIANFPPLLRTNTTCTAFYNECSQYCTQRGQEVLTDGPMTIMTLNRAVQRVGDYLCYVGKQKSPRQLDKTSFSVFMAIWSCFIPNTEVYTVSDDFCCSSALTYESCKSRV